MVCIRRWSQNCVAGDTVRSLIDVYIGKAIMDYVGEYAFSVVFDEKPLWLQKLNQGIVYYRKHRVEKVWGRQKQMLLHRTLTDMRVERGALS